MMRLKRRLSLGESNLLHDADVTTWLMIEDSFDMGGTSTDVSRYDGKFEHTFENVVAGVAVMAPQLDINTVAAGGGSILFFKNG